MIPVSVFSYSTVQSSAQIHITQLCSRPECASFRAVPAFTKHNLIAWQDLSSSTSTHEHTALLHQLVLPSHLISHSGSEGIVQASLRLGFKPSITKSCTSVVTDGGISSGRSPACFSQPGVPWCQLEKTWL